jgi:DNA-directed RNA polymerase subunit alpha
MFALDQFKIKTVAEDAKKGVFEISPLPRGYGQTLGNVLRRILLSSIPGSAITAVKFKDVQHEYSTLANVQDDILTMLLRFKNLPLKSQSEDPITLKLTAKGKAGQTITVTAADIEKDAMVEVVDTEHHITNLTGNTSLDLELRVERGVGFMRAEEDARNEIGLIPLDADFNPVKNVEIEVSQTRVGQKTDLDKILLTVITNGTVEPSVVLHQAAQVLSELSTHMLKSAEDVLSAEPQGLIGTKTENVDEKLENKAPVYISELGLSNRLTNALIRAGYTDLHELDGMADEEIANIKGMGAKSLTELSAILDKHGIKHI